MQRDDDGNGESGNAARRDVCLLQGSWSAPNYGEGQVRRATASATACTASGFGRAWAELLCQAWARDAGTTVLNLEERTNLTHGELDPGT